ncbi:growth hormone secretagogue receptor type 1-like [Astyanax mexicanus]|uniref:Growth hormone secretagogue receptor type 1 n=1 Tax=Astyanax mexicanus TaxID=7994 RepID=A0A8B9R702_ASTMX|nr:growth hormone secretagogue receptor type 1-like [Astyanax mexicanus]
MPAGTTNRSDCARCTVPGAPGHQQQQPPPPPLALFPVPALVAATVACAVLFVAGVAGNLTTIVVVSRYRDMRTTTNLYLRSMALSDLLVFACMPLDLQRVWRYRPWPLGGAVCKLFHFVSESCTHCTALSIAALSVHRYLAVRFPLRAKVAVTRRRVRAVILALWAVSACSAAPVLALVGVEEGGGLELGHENDTGDESWSANWTLNGTGSWSWSASECTATRRAVESGLLSAVVCVSGALVALPALCLCVLYTLIGRKLSRGRRADARSSAREKSHRQSVKLLAVVVLAFVLCWIPFHVVRFLISTSSAAGSPIMSLISQYCSLISFVLFYLSAAINPILYNIMSEKYRAAVCRLFGIQGRQRRGASVTRAESCPGLNESTVSV